MFVLSDEAFQGAHSDAVVGGDKIEVAAAAARGRHRHHPVFQEGGFAFEEGVNEKGRKREIVDEVGLVIVAKVTEVLAVGDIGLGDEDGLRFKVFEDEAKEFDDFVGLF